MAVVEIQHGAGISVDAEDYHRRVLGVVSKSALDKLHESPEKYLAWATYAIPDGDTKAFAFGRHTHAFVLEPDVFDRKYVEEPVFGDQRFKVNKEAAQLWRQENAGRKSVPADDMTTIRGIARSVSKHPIASKLLRGGEAEYTVVWRDAETGLACKSRADYYVPSRKLVVDLKTTEDASPAGFTRSVAKYRYAVQDSLYRAGFAAVGKPVDHFLFIAVEKHPPYSCAVYSLDASSRERGHQMVRDGMAQMAECLAKNEWPGYPAGINEIELPAWAK